MRLKEHGARFDSESVSYRFSWDKKFLQQWNWSDEFATQSGTLKYIQAFCDKNDIRRDNEFNSKIASAEWQGNSRCWLLIDAKERGYTSGFVISGVGILSAPQLPNIPGIADFEGQSFHTSRWPKDFKMSQDLKDERIGVIGTAATGIQTITAISKEPNIASLTVFQRSASWCAPLRDAAISPKKMAKYKTEYDDIFEQCARAPAGFLYSPDPRRTFEVTREERVALWEKLYAKPGFGKWIAVFSNAYTDPVANKEYPGWMADKMRSRISDPILAEKLIPKGHGYGTKRVPLESGYFEAYNKTHMHLVSLRETPISKITSTGNLTSDGTEHKLDVLNFATGFDAITGALAAINWYGEEGGPLFGCSQAEGSSPIWADNDKKTFLGLMAPSLPNVLMILDPHQPYGNVPRSIENSVNVVMSLPKHVHANGYSYVEPTQEAVDAWYDRVVECGKGLLSSEVNSWSTGVNINIEGRAVRKVAKYSGTYQQHLAKCHESEKAGWNGLKFK